MNHVMVVNTKFNFFLNINNLTKISTWIATFLHLSHSLDLDISQGAWGKNELVESSEQGSHEGVRLGDVDLSGVVDIELSPGSGEELVHVRLHLGLRHLLGHEEDLSACLLAALLVENL